MKIFNDAKEFIALEKKKHSRNRQDVFNAHTQVEKSSRNITIFSPK